MLTKQLREMERQAEVVTIIPHFYVSNAYVDHIVKTIGKSNVEVKEGDNDGKTIHLKSVDPITLYRLFRAGIEWKNK